MLDSPHTGKLTEIIVQSFPEMIEEFLDNTSSEDNLIKYEIQGEVPDCRALLVAAEAMHEVLEVSEDDLRSLQIPVHAIVGELDPEKIYLERMRDVVPDFSLTVIPGKQIETGIQSLLIPSPEFLTSHNAVSFTQAGTMMPLSWTRCGARARWNSSSEWEVIQLDQMLHLHLSSDFLLISCSLQDSRSFREVQFLFKCQP